MKDIDKYLNNIAENSNTYNFIKKEIGENSFISMISNKQTSSKKSGVKHEKKNR